MTLASVGGNDDKMVKMSRGLHIRADATIDECSGRSYDFIVLPGVRRVMLLTIDSYHATKGSSWCQSLA